MSDPGTRAIVTGAASGIGPAVARSPLREGASVIAADRNEEGLAPVVEAGATPWVGDLSDESSSMTGQAIDDTGGLVMW